MKHQRAHLHNETNNCGYGFILNRSDIQNKHSTCLFRAVLNYVKNVCRIKSAAILFVEETTVERFIQI